MPSSSLPFGSSSTFGNIQSSGMFQSTATSTGLAQSPFGQSGTGFLQASPSSRPHMFGIPPFGKSDTSFPQTTTSSSMPLTGFGGISFSNAASSIPPSVSPVGFGQTSTAGVFQQTTPSCISDISSTLVTGYSGNLFSNSAPLIPPTLGHMNSSQISPSISAAFQPTLPVQAPTDFSLGNFGQKQQVSLRGSGAVSSISNYGTLWQPSASTQFNMVMQQAPVTNPFGTLPVLPQLSINRTGTTYGVPCGISSMPLTEKSTPDRKYTLLTPRRLSRRRITLPAWKYNPKIDDAKVPFFISDEETLAVTKADAYFIPRENPRSLVICPVEYWPSKTSIERKPVEDTTTENGSPAENGHIAEQNSCPLALSRSTTIQKPKGVHDGHAQKDSASCYTSNPAIIVHRMGEAAVLSKQGRDIELLLPKLWDADYYTEPEIHELAAKEQEEPGFCSHVKNFVIGRHGYGCIKFDGDTDVRSIDLNSVVRFNNREVIVYSEGSRKPPVGQGLNKPAEVTLLNIKCINKKTGQLYTEGPNVEKYKGMLMKKAEEQGAEYISFDAVKGEWKFKVKHFSSYELADRD